MNHGDDVYPFYGCDNAQILDVDDNGSGCVCVVCGDDVHGGGVHDVHVLMLHQGQVMRLLQAAQLVLCS